MASTGEEHSRQILAYWSAERMQGAQPESTPEYVDSPAMTSQEILDYWTPERLLAAQPEKHAYDDHREEDEIEFVRGELQGAGSLKIVPDDKVKTFPYQSVGKLFYTKAGGDSFSSAWAVNAESVLHVVFTAAHSLENDRGQASNILFIPGFIPPSSAVFGQYPQIPGGKGVAWGVDPNWDPKNPQCRYDRGAVRLDKDPHTGKYVDEVVTPIQTIENQIYSPTSAWNTIGYPLPSSGNPDGKMAERNGTFYKMSSDGGSFYKYGTVPGGTSGGPWILDGTQLSNGIQAGNVSQYQSAVSPYFQSSAVELVKKVFGSV